MSKVIDLTGKRFGRLTVLHRVENTKAGQSQWMCKCDCGTQLVVAGQSLRNGRSKSCGCKRAETAKKRLKKFNEYRLNGNVVYVKLSNTDREMIVDEDVWNAGAKDFCWYLTRAGYAATQIPGQRSNTLFHVYAFPDCPDGLVRDHIDGNKLNNVRENMRFITQQNNVRNRTLRSKNKSGRIGVVWSKRDNKWMAKIKTDGKEIHLGSFAKLEDAVKAREDAEEKYFGEYRRKE